MRWCVYCKRMVGGVKPLSVLTWLLIIVLSGVTFGLFLVYFIPYFIFFKKRRCPICNTTELTRSAPSAT